MTGTRARRGPAVLVALLAGAGLVLGTAPAGAAPGPSTSDRLVLGHDVWDIALSPDGSAAYLTGDAGSGAGAVITVLDTASRAVTASIPVPGLEAGALHVSPDGGRVYALGAADVTVIDLASHTVLATHPLPDQPRPEGWSAGGYGASALSPDGRRLYIAQNGPRSYKKRDRGRLIVLDTASGEVTTVPVEGEDLTGLAALPDNATLYVAGRRGYLTDVPDLIRLDVSQLPPAVTRTVDLPEAAVGVVSLAASPDGGRLYPMTANRSGPHHLSLVHTGTDEVEWTAQLPLSLLPSYPVAGPGGRLYTVDGRVAPSAITVLDQTDGVVLGTLDPMIQDVTDLAAAPSGDTLYAVGRDHELDAGLLTILTPGQP